MTELGQLVTNIGFPASCVLLLGYFVLHMYDSNDKRTKELTEAINELKIVINVLITKLNIDNDDKNENK